LIVLLQCYPVFPSVASSGALSDLIAVGCDQADQPVTVELVIMLAAEDDVDVGSLISQRRIARNHPNVFSVGGNDEADANFTFRSRQPFLNSNHFHFPYSNLSSGLLGDTSRKGNLRTLRENYYPANWRKRRDRHPTDDPKWPTSECPTIQTKGSNTAALGASYPGGRQPTSTGNCDLPDR
jgi:hypothetical protein